MTIEREEEMVSYIQQFNKKLINFNNNAFFFSQLCDCKAFSIFTIDIIIQHKAIGIRYNYQQSKTLQRYIVRRFLFHYSLLEEYYN